jgi:UDP-glucose 4-epimerase
MSAEKRSISGSLTKSVLHMKIMVTGGAGYIGSHTCVELINAGHEVVIFDNFCNSNVEVVGRIERITGTVPTVVRGDVRDCDRITEALATHRCEAVIHFAGLKSVAESVAQPLLYYENNVLGSMRLVQAMKKAGVGRLVFSSSATVYGDPIFLPLTEDHPKAPYSPYGRTKLVVEDMLTEVVQSSENFKVAILRYFNPVGCHMSGLIGEDPLGVPNNLMPFIAQVAVGRRSHVNIFGNDYDTPDGTGIRDYVHVVDLAIGHLRALEHLSKEDFIQVNLGSCTHFPRPVAGKFHLSLQRGGRVTLRVTMPVPIWRRKLSAGERRESCMICVRIPGDGRARIRTATQFPRTPLSQAKA